MIRNLKVLGLALVAVLAMSAMVASAASAVVVTPAKFTSAINTTNFTTTGTNHVFEVTGLAVNCATATFTGEATGTSVPTVTLRPTYTECTAKLGVFNVNATVTGFGHLKAEKDEEAAAKHKAETEEKPFSPLYCEYTVHAAGTADLDCPTGREVTVDAGTCTVHVKPQENLGTITYDNEEAGGVKDVKATLNLTKVDVNHTDGFGCPFTGSGSGAIGTLGGTSTVTGTNSEGKPVSVSWDPAVEHP